MTPKGDIPLRQPRIPGEIDLAIYARKGRIVLFDTAEMLPVVQFSGKATPEGNISGMKDLATFLHERNAYSIRFDQAAPEGEILFLLWNRENHAVHPEEPYSGCGEFQEHQEPGQGWEFAGRLLHCESEFCEGRYCPVYATCRYPHKEECT